MATKKKTLYEILEVSPTATKDEIRAAHQRMSRKLLAAASQLSREEVDFKLQVLDVALHTLSTPLSRDEYDAQIAPLIPSTNIPTPYTDANALRIAAALEESNRISAALIANQPLPLKAVSTTVNSTIKSLSTIFRLLIGLVVFAVVVKWGTAVLAQRTPSAAASSAAEKTMLLEYEQTQGASASNDPVEVERRRKENAEKAAELEKQKREDAERKFVEESRRIGNKVTDNLSREDARAQDEAARKAWQLAQEQRQREEAQRRQAEAEKRRIAEERRKLGLPY